MKSTDIAPNCFYQTKCVDIFSYFSTKHMLWILIRSALPRQGTSNEYPLRMFLWRNKKHIFLDTTYLEQCLIRLYSLSTYYSKNNFCMPQPISCFCLFFQLHGDIISSNEELIKELEDVADVQKSSWKTVQDLFNQTLCLVNYFRTATLWYCKIVLRYFSYFCIMCCGYSLELLWWASSTKWISTICFGREIIHRSK